MKRNTKVLYLHTKHRAGRHLRRTLHHLDHPGCKHPAPDAYTASGDHLERHIHSTQNLDNPPVERPYYVTQLDGKVVRYTGP